MNAYTFKAGADQEGPISGAWSAPGADRFGIQISPIGEVETVSVTLQGSINGSDWVDLVTADLKNRMVASGGMSKNPVVCYLRADVRTFTAAPGASVKIHVVAK